MCICPKDWFPTFLAEGLGAVRWARTLAALLMYGVCMETITESVAIGKRDCGLLFLVRFDLQQIRDQFR